MSSCYYETLSNTLVANCSVGVRTESENFGPVNALAYTTLAGNATNFWARYDNDCATVFTNSLVTGGLYGILHSANPAQTVTLCNTFVANNAVNTWSPKFKIVANAASYTNDVEHLLQPGTFELDPRSPALNAALDIGVATDLDGRGRPRQGGFDVGALELQPPAATLLLLR